MRNDMVGSDWDINGNSLNFEVMFAMDTFFSNYTNFEGLSEKCLK